MIKTIDLNEPTHCRFLLFPDNQPHVIIQDINAGDEVNLICPITDSLKLMHLLQVANAISHLGAIKKILIIPYLMAARYDRLMQTGDSFDLEVVAGLINSCEFEKILLWDVHSEVALRLINKSVNIPNRPMVQAYQQPDAVLICPDAGASKKVNEYPQWNKNIKEVVYCNKKRELSTGSLTLEVTDPDKCKGRNCVIIDDICDGGATFLAIANQIQPKHLTLIVTHGIFSKGFAALEQKFNEIIVSDSYRRNYDNHIVKTLTVKIDAQQS